MTITNTTLGNYTTQITLNGETGSAPFIAALDTAILTGGWTQHDVTNSTYRVYKALNIDAITYKYSVVSIDQFRQRFWLSSYESWDASSHIGTNEVHTMHGGYWQPYTFNNCEVVVFSSLRWLGFQVYIRNVPAPHPVFVTETTRDHTQDTAAGGIPCWGWMTPAATSQPAPVLTGLAKSYLFSTPRTKSGYTGMSASGKSFISTTFGRVSNGTYSTPNAISNFNSGLSTLIANTSSNVWDSSAIYAQTLRVGHTYSELQGRIVGLKATKIANAGLMNRVSVPVDSSFLYDNAGTPIEHWILPINSDKITSTSTGSVSFPVGGVTDMVWNGNTIFIGRSSVVVKYELNTNILATPIPVVGTVTSMIYDGSNIYFCNTTKIAKWDTTTDTISYSAPVTGATMNRMCFDGTYFWAVDSNPTGTNILVRKYDISLTLVSTVTVNSASGSGSCDISCDNMGNIVILIVNPSVVSANLICKISASTGLVVSSYQYGINLNGSRLDNYGSVNWMGATGQFDIFTSPGGVVGTNFTGDFSSNTFIYSTAGAVSSNMSPSYSRYMSIPRYGRIMHSAYTTLNTTDYETDDPRITTVQAQSGQQLTHLGTHIISVYSNNLIITPTNGIYMPNTGAQMLLPK